ncbi:MAG: response regulator [Bacteroidales bacterium]|nr:response regulator [Bacteroidales bacterium]
MNLKEITSNDELRKIAFSSHDMDWFKVDINEKLISIGEELVQSLELKKNIFSFDEALNLLSSECNINFGRILHSKINRVELALNENIFKNNKLIANISRRDSDCLIGFIQIVTEEYIETISRYSSTHEISFLANMSHELRTPLNAIVGFSKILAQTETQKEKNEYVKIINDNNEVLMQLISDILDLSKIQADVLEIRKSNVDLIDVMREIANCAKLRLETYPIEFRLLEPKINNCFINTDINRLTQVVNNLINNSIKFTPSGYIILGYELLEDDVFFYVEDSGVGIPSDKLNTIFNRFVRLDKTVSGTGLGLEICSSVINKLGGKIGVESTLGKGSKFWFTLPNNLKESIEVETSSVSVNVEKEDSNKICPKMLIAEDDPSNYKLCEVLLKNKFNLYHAWDGKQAVSLFERISPDVVLMDINMPEMNGYEATKLIREKDWTTPIIAVTAYAFSDDEAKILKSGFDGYLPKPIDAGMLKNLIETHLKK